MKTKNIVISGTNFWNPGDDFVRDGVIRILRRLFKDCTLNFLFYNFNQDFYPQSKFSGIHNMAAAGDLDKYRELIDAVVVAGLSAGNEIKDLYRWIIENSLLDRVYLIGAGYENTYVEEHIRREPEATVFKHARIITGRTEKRPSFITEHGLPYHHVSCPAILSVESVKNIPVQANIRTIAFSIQLPHGVGVPNHCCNASMYKLAAHTLLELFPKYRVEIVAHHKQEYFHFLNLVKGHDIPVFFSSFYQDLYDIYRRFDVVISTRLHACIYANSHGIPGIIVNDTDRHTHCARGFPHLAWVNTREMLHQELESICRQDLRRIAKDNKEFKDKLMQKYLTLLAEPFGADPSLVGKPRFDKLNIGCGSDYRQGCVNIDGNPDLPKVDLVLDTKPGILLEHFEPGSFSYILAQDFLEHHFHWEARGLLEDFHALLGNKGRLDVRLPNIEKVINDSNKDIGKKALHLYGGQDMQQKWEAGSPNLSRRQYPQYFCHKYGWTPDSIRSELLSVGFSAVEITDEGWNMKVVAEKTAPGIARGEDDLPVHFLTIVLNGQPFIRHHIDIFKQLPFKWHWHIVEGLADLKHDTAWSLERGGRISEQLHRNGLSNDGTTEYIDELARHYPANITVYRKPAGAFWDGKLEMVNAPLAGINEPCLLWQVDSDELWTAEQICAARDMFVAEPDRTAAYYLDHFFVGENLVTTTIDTYGNNTGYEWLRTWRFRPGFRWSAHEPPRLCMPAQDGGWVDVATIKPFKHAETAARNLVFQHYAYATAKQLAFKEIYYGYSNAVAQWQRLQQQTDFPVMLKNYFAWVKDEAQVNTIHSQNITPLAWKDGNDQWRFCSRQQTSGQQPAQPSKDHKKILIVRPDAIGDFVIFSGALPYYRRIYPNAEITIVVPEGVANLVEACPFVDEVITFDRGKMLSQPGYAAELVRHLRSKQFAVAICPVFSRDKVSDFIVINSSAAEKITCSGDTANLPADVIKANNVHYTKVIPMSEGIALETFRNEEFLKGLGIELDGPYRPAVWITQADKEATEHLLHHRAIKEPIVIAPFAQRDIRNWRAENWAKLISMYPDMPVVICGLEKDRPAADTIIGLANHPNVHNLCGLTTVRHLAALIARASLCISTESAAAHLAAAVNRPHVVLVGGGHFGRFMPYSSQTRMVYNKMDCYHCNWQCRYGRDIRCITSISVDMVKRAVDEALGTAPSLSARRADAVAEPYEKDNTGESRFLVSAIVSTYNSEKFIRGCLEDLENQTIADRLEIIVVNSGSLENEETIVREYQQKYDNIVYIKTEQREGIYSAWNRAVRAARGTFLTNANTDDRHREDALEKMAEILLAHPDVALVYGDQICTDTANGTFANHHPVEMAARPEYSRERLLLGCCVGSQPMWRKSLHTEFGYFDESLDCAGDWDFWIRISGKYQFRHIPEFLGLYYYNPDGIEHGRKIHSLYERYIVGRRYGTEYIAVIPYCRPKPDDPLASVVMPVHNGAKYIAEAIESVLIQSYPMFELIIVDDGSTDATNEVLSTFKDERIRYIYKENNGPSSARNQGILQAQGRYIIPLDADDMVTPDCLLKHLQQFQRNPDADLVYCDVLLIDQNGRPLNLMRKPEYQDRRHLIRDLFRAGHPIVPFRLGIRRSVFEKIGFYDETLLVGEDYDMMRRFVKAGLKAYHLGEALHLRRMQPNSLTRNYSAQKAKCHFEVVKRFPATFAYDELFPDVPWHEIPAETRPLHANCLAVMTYLAIGQDFVKSNSPSAYVKMAFDAACSQLNDCLRIDPDNREIRQLLHKCERGRQQYDRGMQEAVCRAR